MAVRAATLACALLLTGATTAATAPPALAATQASAPVLHSTTYRYAYGYTLYLKIVRHRAGWIYADCTVQGTGPDKRVAACQLLRSTGGGGGTAYSSGWNSAAAVAYSRRIELRCGPSYRVFVRFQTWGGPLAKTFGTWYRRCR